MAEITVQATTIPNYQAGGSTASIRIYATENFFGGGVEYQAGLGYFYKNVACTVASSTVTVPSFTLESTTDSTNDSAKYVAILFDANGSKVATLMNGIEFSVFPTNTTPTWREILLQNQAVRRRMPDHFYTSTQIDQLLDGFLEPEDLVWGSIEGDLVDQTDLQDALDDKADAIHGHAISDVTSLQSSLDSKQATLVSATNIKTINNSSILGSGNLAVSDFTKLSNYADLAAAVTAIGSTPTTLMVDADSTVSTAITIPDTLELLFINGKKFTKSGSGTITFEGYGVINTPPVQIFSGFTNDITGTAEVKWTEVYPETLYPEWFGAVGDGVTDDSDAFEAAVYCMQGEAYQGTTIMLSSKTYALTRPWHIQRPVLVTSPGTRDWQSGVARLQFSVGTAGVVLHGQSTYDGVAGTYTGTMSELRGFAIISNDAANNTVVSTNGLTITITGGSVTEVSRRGLNVAGDVSAIAPGSTITINGYDYVITHDLSATPTASIPILEPRFLISSDGVSALRNGGGPFPSNSDWVGSTITCDLYANVDFGRERYTRTISSHDLTNIAFTEGALPSGLYVCTVSGIKVQAGQNARINMYPGLDLRTQCKVRSVYVEGFSGNGVQMHSGKNPTVNQDSEPNNNNSLLERVTAEACDGSGFVLSGVNTNNTETHLLNFRNNHGYGVYEVESLGSNHYGWHAAYNYHGAFRMTGTSARNMIFNCYTEGGQPPGIIGQKTILIGGNHAAGIDRRLSTLSNHLVSDNNGLMFEHGLAIRKYRGYYGTGFNPFGWILNIGRQADENTILSFGTADDDNNAGDGIYRPSTPSYYFNYGSTEAGWYALGYTNNGNQSGANANPLLQISGSEASRGPGILKLPKGFDFGNTSGGNVVSALTPNTLGLVSDKNVAGETLQVVSAGSQPSAAAALRGTVWNSLGGAGVADVMQVCLKDATDAYAWTDLGGATSPLVLTAGAASETPLRLQMAASQTANPLIVRNSSAVDVFAVSPAGHVLLNSPTKVQTTSATYVEMESNFIKLRGNSGTEFVVIDTFLYGPGGFIGRPTVSAMEGVFTKTSVSVKTGSYAVDANETNRSFTNEGAGAKIDFTLPAAAVGLTYFFYVQDADGLRAVAGAGDTIRIGASVSAAAGNIDSTTVGSSVRLTAVNATEWVAEYSTGTWTVT